uniref:O antigen flippase n=1 Tax=Aeromonas hydrophila TaxID=644 RepID=A0A346AD49_AERHY|nr:O antigen flippase [Aeromonas hydrophila]
MESKKFIAVTVVLYLSSLISYYIQIKIIDLYGLQVKYYFDLYMSYLQITITLAIFGLPNALSLIVSREKKIPKNIKSFVFFCAVAASLTLNVFFLHGSLFVQALIFFFLYASLFNDLNTGIMSSVGMFEYPRIWQLLGNIALLVMVFIGQFNDVLFSTLGESERALIFIVTPIIPLFVVINFGNKFKAKLATYETISLFAVFKYINYIYIFSIMSIIMTRIPYVNFSRYIDKYSLAQYTLSLSLSNFIVIPLNVLALKMLSSHMKEKPKIFLINSILLTLVFFSAITLYFFSMRFDFLHQLTNISSFNILASTYLVVATVAISSVNLSVALRMQKKIKHFLILDVILVAVVFLISFNLIYSFDDLSGYNYLIVSAVFVKILFQNYLLRD